MGLRVYVIHIVSTSFILLTLKHNLHFYIFENVIIIIKNKRRCNICHELRKTTTRKPIQRRKRKHAKLKRKATKTDSSIRYIIAIVIVIISILGIFQLGLVGRMIDSFFNYLFGASRYLTYILVSLITIYIAMQRHFPKHVVHSVSFYYNLYY